MGANYLTWLADAFRGAGLKVNESSGWERRARSSGGFADKQGPLCVMWHHTASNGSPQSQVNYQLTASTAPIANASIAPDGVVWLMAAGATNTNGQGGPATFSRGTVPTNRMNEFAFGMEIMNDGVGGLYPQVQIDSAFQVSLVVNARVGNRPDDVLTHSVWSPGRKIDPARAKSVQGPWRPRGFNGGSDSWVLDDLKAECLKRAAHPLPVPPEPIPVPDPPEPLPGDNTLIGLGMYQLGIKIDGAPGDGVMWVRVTGDLIIAEPNADAKGIDDWFGVPAKTAGANDAATLFVSRRATAPYPFGQGDPWFSQVLADAWHT